MVNEYDLNIYNKLKRAIRISKNLIALYFWGIQIMLPFCCHRGYKHGKKPLFTGFFVGVKLFPLHCSGGFGGYVIDYAVDVLNFVGDSV